MRRAMSVPIRSHNILSTTNPDVEYKGRQEKCPQSNKLLKMEIIA